MSVPNKTPIRELAVTEKFISNLGTLFGPFLSFLVCSIFVARPTLRMGPPTEAGHTAIWAPAHRALDLITNEGDRVMLELALRQVGPR